MLRNGNLGLRMGVSRAAHTQYAYGSTPTAMLHALSVTKETSLLQSDTHKIPPYQK